MDEERAAASTDDERLSAMSALAQPITNIDLVRTIAHVRVEAESWTDMRSKDMFFAAGLGSQFDTGSITPATILNNARDRVATGRLPRVEVASSENK